MLCYGFLFSTYGKLEVGEMICILYGFPCEMEFSHHESLNPARVACDECGILRQVVRNPSHMENRIIYSFTLQGTLVVLNGTAHN